MCDDIGTLRHILVVEFGICNYGIIFAEYQQNVKWFRSHRKIS